MKQKPCMISFRVNESQKRCLYDMAQRLDITVSMLLLRMAGAYIEAEEKGESVTAVSYGEWLLVYYDLAGIETALNKCAQQISATRYMVSLLRDKGAIANWRVREAIEDMSSCRDEVIEVRKQITNKLEQLERMGDAWIATDASGLPVGSPLSEA